jgi:predicted transcriptional regulator
MTVTSTSGDEMSEHVTLRMPSSLVAELRAVARENDRSLSAEARLALRSWLTAYDARRAA